MREILFRGKCTRGKHSGEWVTGDLWHHADKGSIIYSNELDNKAWVSTKTVGQFTGKTHKSGARIFEADIVEYTNKDGTKARYVIEWNDVLAAWAAKWTSGEGHLCLNAFVCECMEIIGNIHDNPELLEANHAK
jgi:uncharacterized phage protein (TIGR01671 family)